MKREVTRWPTGKSGADEDNSPTLHTPPIVDRLDAKVPAFTPRKFSKINRLSRLRMIQRSILFIQRYVILQMKLVLRQRITCLAQRQHPLLLDSLQEQLVVVAVTPILPCSLMQGVEPQDQIKRRMADTALLMFVNQNRFSLLTCREQLLRNP